MKGLVRLSFSFMLVVCFPLPTHSTPLGPGFSYQGQLILNGNPVNGTANLRFSLWDAAGSGSPPVGGNQIGASQIVANVPVTNGLFVVQLNDANQFGTNPFTGDARWLQVEVCTDGTCSAVTVLAPRQPLLATPYAQYAGPWRLLGGNAYFSGGNVGIGTSAPTAQLSLGSNNANSKLLVWDDGSPNGLGFGIGPNQFRLHLGLPANRFSFLDGPAGNELVTIQGTGNVGISTDSPTKKLSVKGDIALGPNAEYNATSGEENLRILRGSVAFNGTPLRGCCFWVDHPAIGTFTINFNTPFAAIPSVIATSGPYNLVISTFANRITVYVDDKDGNPVDWGFDFVVVGPR